MRVEVVAPAGPPPITTTSTDDWLESEFIWFVSWQNHYLIEQVRSSFPRSLSGIQGCFTVIPDNDFGNDGEVRLHLHGKRYVLIATHRSLLHAASGHYATIQQAVPDPWPAYAPTAAHVNRARRLNGRSAVSILHP